MLTGSTIETDTDLQSSIKQKMDGIEELAMFVIGNIGDEIEFTIGNKFVLFKGRFCAEGISEILKVFAGSLVSIG